jgi:hypothetical protein
MLWHKYPRSVATALGRRAAKGATAGAPRHSEAATTFLRRVPTYPKIPELLLSAPFCSLTRFARVLRGRGSSRSRSAFPNQHQITNVNEGVRQISEDANGISLENKVEAHDHTTGDAPIPKRDRDHAFALAFRSQPLHKKTHRKSSVPDKAEHDEITPIQTEESVFFPDPRDSDKCECVHRLLIDSAIP